MFFFSFLQAQNIKNFKSQRWQTLLNFNSQRRLLLTGTPLQNSLMELWSLMHFLMPTVFSSHSDFREWFSNPLTGMVEGSQEYSESIVRRLHQVCNVMSVVVLCWWLYLKGFTSIFVTPIKNGSGETNAKKVWAHYSLSSVQETTISLWRVHVKNKARVNCVFYKKCTFVLLL